jgi:MFS transporter, UMF1 family
MASELPDEAGRVAGGTVTSGAAAWMVLDFLLSLFAVNGLLCFSFWIVQGEGVHPFSYGLVYALAAALVVLTLPLLGWIIDGRFSGSQVLVTLSLLMGAAAALSPMIARLGDRETRVAGALLLFGLLAYTFQAALIPYDWMLVRLRGLSGVPRTARVAVLGKGVGSLGAAAGALLAALLLRDVFPAAAGWRRALCVVAVLFMIAVALDFLIFLRKWVLPEDPETVRTMALRSLLGDGFAMARRSAELRRFLIGFFLFANALFAVLLYLPLWLRERWGLAERELALALAAALAVAAIGAFVTARTIAASGARKVLVASLALWAVVLIALGLIGSAGWLYPLLLAAGALHGTLWAASRAYLIEIAPADLVGRVRGFHVVFGRCASILGPLLWGGVMLLGAGAESRYRIAFLLMALLVAASLSFLSRRANADRVERRP